MLDLDRRKADGLDGGLVEGVIELVYNRKRGVLRLPRVVEFGA